MLLYINGDAFGAAACSVNNFVYASDDTHQSALGARAHPDNAMHSYGYYLSRLLGLGFYCDAAKRNSNAEIFESVENFVSNTLPALKSQHTAICIGLMPRVDVEQLNRLAATLDRLKLERIFFNTQSPMPKNSSIAFGNYFDLTDPDECFVSWCKNQSHTVNNSWPDAAAHNAWAKHIFGKMIEQL
jgi:hypothetical protein